MAEGFPPAWELRGGTLLAEGIGGRVWEAEAPDGERVIVKRLSALALAEAHQGAAFLRWRDGRAAVRLLGEAGPWQLLEHAGDETLLDVLDRDGDAAATAIACGVLHELHALVAAPAPDELQALHARFGSLLNRKADVTLPEQEGLLSEAAAEAQRLLDAQEDVRPLHGDIHHGNMLRGARGWLAIDPHGLFGDPAYDTANLFYNPVERPMLRRSEERIAAMAGQIAAATGRSRRTLLGYGFAHASLSACWHLEDGNEAEARASLGVAGAVRRVMGAA